MAGQDFQRPPGKNLSSVDAVALAHCFIAERLDYLFFYRVVIVER